MASLRKLRVQQERARKRKEEREKRMAQKHKEGALQNRRAKFKRKVKETLGFDRFKFKGAYATLD